MTQFYSDPKRESDPHSLPDLEVFYLSEWEALSLINSIQPGDQDWHGDNTKDYVGWWWWACFPGCIPEGAPSGPFDTEANAIKDATTRERNHGTR